MAESKNKPGVAERLSFIGRNIDIVAMAIAAFANSVGGVAFFGLSALVEHYLGKKIQKKRLAQPV